MENRYFKIINDLVYLYFDWNKINMNLLFVFYIANLHVIHLKSYTFSVLLYRERIG